MHRSLNILLDIKYLRPDHRLECFLPERISRIGWKKDVSFADKTWCKKVQRKLASQGKNVTINSISFTLMIIAPNVVTKELLGLAKKEFK